jgi:hypothetical protein
MIKPSDLNATQYRAFTMWRNLGLSEQSALRAMEQDGVIEVSEEERQARVFRSAFGLTEEGARVAAGGRGPRPVRGTTAQPSAVTVAETRPDNRRRLIENIERIAYNIRQSGTTLCLWNGESREQASLRAAYYKVLEAAQEDATKLWVIRVVKSCWPRLTETGPGSTASPTQPSAGRSASKPVPVWP